MKKIINLVLAIFFSVQIAQAQTGRQHLGFTIGPSFAMSEFSQTDLNDSTSGFAKTGTGINVVYAFRLGHNLGFEFNIGFNSNSLDNIKLTEAGTKHNPNMSYNVENTNPWNTGVVLFGPYLRFPLSLSLSWDFRGSIGLYSAYSPDFIIRGSTTAGETAQYKRDASKSFSFGYSIGTGFKYRIGNYYILLFGDYGGTNAKFNHITGTNWDNQHYDIPLAQKINSLRISVGFAYIF